MTLFSLTQLLLGFVLCKFSSTMPTDLNPRVTGQDQTYRFEDLGSTVTSLAAIGLYHDLDVNLILGSSKQNPPITGLTLISYTNAAVFTTREELVDGMGEIKIPGNGVGALYFFLKSFNFGCVAATAQATLTVPTPCTIKITLSRNGIVVGTPQESFVYDTEELAPTVQKFTVDSSFGYITSVTFEIVESEATEALKAGVIDDVDLVTYK